MSVVFIKNNRKMTLEIAVSLRYYITVVINY